jgi:hypothetical protein
MIGSAEKPLNDKRALIYNWLSKQMEVQKISGKIYRGAIRVIRERSLRRPVVVVPVYVETCNDAWDCTEILQNLEDAWNEQEPEPKWTVFLKPAAKPRAERQS